MRPIQRTGEASRPAQPGIRFGRLPLLLVAATHRKARGTIRGPAGALPTARVNRPTPSIAARNAFGKRRQCQGKIRRIPIIFAISWIRESVTTAAKIIGILRILCEYAALTPLAKRKTLCNGVGGGNLSFAWQTKKRTSGTGYHVKVLRVAGELARRSARKRAGYTGIHKTVFSLNAPTLTASPPTPCAAHLRGRLGVSRTKPSGSPGGDRVWPRAIAADRGEPPAAVANAKSRQ